MPYCELYDKGYKRLGCIGCPMSTRQESELKAYPKFKALYLQAFGKMLARMTDDSKITTWKSAEDVMTWWLGKQTEPIETMITEELKE